MVGYIYKTEQEAINAVNSVNKYYGIPISEDSVTQTFTDFNHIENIGYFIVYIEELKEILGEPTEIILN